MSSKSTIAKIESAYGKRASAAILRAADSWAQNLGQSIESIHAAAYAAVETVARAYAGAANISLPSSRRTIAAVVRHLGCVDSGDMVHVRMTLGYGGVGDARGAWPILSAYTRSLRGAKPVTYSTSHASGDISASLDYAGHIIGYASAQAWNSRMANGSLDAVLSGTRTAHQRWLAMR